jgi:long-chain-fatty-acid--[acyl-carrier-protein] ligase
VILFTSGSEFLPKGVPLSHENVLSNIGSFFSVVHELINPTDAVYSVLPPFHAFGLIATGLFSILIGTKVAFYADPTDSQGIANGIERWNITVFATVPNFLKNLLPLSHQLKNIRYFISGGEKVPDSLFSQTDKPLLEAYGMTECAGAISVHLPHLPAKGVGYLFPKVEIQIIHPETFEILPRGLEGEICVSGPMVFNGYLGNVPSAFIELEGKKWYRTGDLGIFDGALFVTGRLKRFVKMGGEMISLTAIEDALNKALQPEKLPSLAVVFENQKLILFTILELNKDEGNQHLIKAGFSNLFKISTVKKVSEIPLLASGKINYHSLR